MWTTAEPVVREWIDAQPRAGRPHRGRGAGRRRGRPLPRPGAGLLGRAAPLADQLDAATRDGIVLAPETVAAIGEAEARRNRWTAAALWVIAALLALVLWQTACDCIDCNAIICYRVRSPDGAQRHPERRSRISLHSMRATCAMASLTVRQLDEKLKKLLRMRAARHGRSMEDEVRVILRRPPRTPGARRST